MSIADWRDPSLVRTIIDLVFDAMGEGRSVSTIDLKERLSTQDPQDLTNLVDELVSSGYLLGKPYGGSFDHVFEHGDLRLGLRAILELQREMCFRFAVDPVSVDLQAKVGVARNLSNTGMAPLNGLRHPPEEDTSGWYLWRGGEIPQDDPEFFQPLHAAHLTETCPDALPYLALPPGWRFLLAPGQQEVWHDPGLLDVLPG